ncbi:MAG: peptidoglycan editing factor PgeF [Rhizobiaceae bacterium]|nr:peptidoglycan editing factor PgeF [Rhizobiaceae bacterium]
MSKLLPIQSQLLDDLEGIKHGYFTRQGGVSKGIYSGLNAGLGSGDNRQDVVENRRRITQQLKVAEDKLAAPYQVHSPDVVIADQAWTNDRPKADGVVTNQPGLAIGVVTADCGPVLFADADAGIIGACHAGWKGALGGVLENTVAKMVEIGAQPASITAILGPTISQKNYQVGPGFPDPFLSRSAENLRYFTTSDKTDHYQFDLTGYIVDRLAKTGIRANAVNRCTYGEEDNFYSYRRTTHRNESDYGRQLSAIVMNNR